MASTPPRRGRPGRGPSPPAQLAGPIVGLALVAVFGAALIYRACRIEVGQGRQAVLLRKVGRDLEPGMEIAPPRSDEAGYSKGVQPEVLTEGRYFYNPFYWDWEFSDQFLVPEGKCAVRIALAGEEMPEGRVLAGPGEKGIRPGVIEAGSRVAYNPYAETFELFDPVEVPPGHRGVRTLLAGREPTDPNVVLVDDGERGVQQRTLGEGTYFINPYEQRISVVDCRTKKFGLNEAGDISFLSADGFSISLDGAVTFEVMEDRAAEVYVLYNEDFNGDAIDEEIISKIITPESRSICRINGSKLTGSQFISGDERQVFQDNLAKTLAARCAEQGIQIDAEEDVYISKIRPPQEIAQPVRQREVAKRQLDQFLQETAQQESEAQLKVKTLLADQKARLVEAEQQVVEQKTKAEQDQKVAVTQAEQQLAVAETQLEAARDQAAALEAEAGAGAEVIRYQNTAELAGLATRVKAFDGDGSAIAQNILIGKLAPAYRSILSNTEGPLMDLFAQFTEGGSAPASPSTGGPLASEADDGSDDELPVAMPDQPFETDSSTTTAEARP